MNYRRILDIQKLIQKKSHFLFGARSTGKSTLIEVSHFEKLSFDLLDDEIYDDLLRRPKLIEERIMNKHQVIVIDEIQRIPKLHNEVQRLMKTVPNHFLLTVSSARKLKKGGENLLGGRAWEAQLYPLVSHEIIDFDLNKYLNRGGLPHIYLSEDYEDELKNYVRLYLRQEIVAEALTRNTESFIRFLDVFALSNGEELHYQGLSNDSGVLARTIQNYVEILEDTLVGFQVKPFLATVQRKAIARSKFYFFDVGVVNSLCKRGKIVSGSELFGKAFEHFIIREIKSWLSYKKSNEELYYWRSTSQFEVDAIIGRQWAIEIKSTSQVNESHLKGLKALREEGLIKRYSVVSLDSEPRKIQGIEVLPWQEFLRQLWRT
ncbi:MAG: ATP-binding protein [Xanthomonadaceae bacterium]|nr:ATP-binding protein [Xanthomonadaceae bacterium]